MAQLAACVSILAFLYYLRQGQILLYGDAVAHINIARRVLDSRTPGPLQLGTVWLPLPHLLTLPLLVSDWLWKTGIGGSISSLFAYVIAAVGIFNLVRGSGPASMPARTAAWITASSYSRSQLDLSAEYGHDGASVFGIFYLVIGSTSAHLLAGIKKHSPGVHCACWVRL